MSEDKARLADVLIKALGLLGLAIGGAFSYFQYFDGLARQRETEARESRKPFLAQRLELYGQAMKAAAELATVSSDKDRLARAEENFWYLYWGPLASVESREVEGAMVRFGQCLRDPQCSSSERQQLSLGLSHIVRNETQSTWDVSLPDLADKKK